MRSGEIRVTFFDYRSLSNNALRVRRGPSIQNDKCSQCPRYQSIAQTAPEGHQRISTGLGCARSTQISVAT
jgi:hypothetical protein